MRERSLGPDSDGRRCLPPPRCPSSDCAMTPFNRLIAGYRRFRDQRWDQERARWSELAEGQSPKAMVIACSDSRVDPAEIFGTRPGEIFVVRNVANLAPPYETSKGYHGVS